MARNEITLLKSISSSSCNCNSNNLSSSWIDIKVKHRMKSHCSKKDKNVNLELTNKFEPLTALEPKIVAQLDKSVNPKASNKKCKKFLLLGSSHARGLNYRLRSVLESEYAVTSLFKHNAGLRIFN